MFLEQTIKRNPGLIKASFELHQSGQIRPDSYVIDVDTFLENASFMLKEAKEKEIRLFFMLKQAGRNPYLARKLVELGYEGAVVVDYKEARVMMDHQIPIANAGHLVQIPTAQVEEIVAYRPQMITVYSEEKKSARSIMRQRSWDFYRISFSVLPVIRISSTRDRQQDSPLMH